MALAYARKLADTGQYQLLVLDEISHVIRWGLLTVDDVLEFLQWKPPDLEVVLTGRQMAPEILAVADLVTELAAVKHPLEKGIPSRRGIEY
jgi:cob(I)alamin adenosyltransferase